MEIHPAARRHGLSDADIRHVVTHHLAAIDLPEEDSEGEEAPWRVLYLGPDRAGNLREVVVIERDDGSEQAIHAMKMQTKYESLLPDQGVEW